MAETVFLYQFPRPRAVANLGFFCLKVETLIRMTAIPYEIKTVINTAQAPKGKLPYIVHQGQKISDSSHIIDYLRLQFALTIDDDLSAEQLAIGHAVSTMLEERLRWCIVYSRWLDDRYAPTFKGLLDDFISFPLKVIFPLVLANNRRRIATTLASNGIGKFTPEEIYAFGQQDIAALTAILGDKPYLFGERPSSYDAVVNGFLANLIDVPMACPLNTFARDRETLRNYCQRMKANYFADL